MPNILGGDQSHPAYDPRTKLTERQVLVGNDLYDIGPAPAHVIRVVRVDGNEYVHNAWTHSLPKEVGLFISKLVASDQKKNVQPKHEDQPKLIGVCHIWIRNVTLLGYGAYPNKYIPPGTTGDMEVIEISVDGRVLQARFHPGGEGKSNGLVVWPKWKYRSSTMVAKDAECTCYHDCGKDSHSGDWHQHESEPCPVHPDATMVG